MFPSVLMATVLAGQSNVICTPLSERFIPSSMLPRLPYVPLIYPLDVYGDPPHLRGYPWKKAPVDPFELSRPSTVSPPSDMKLVEPAPAVRPAATTPTDPTAERIATLEYGIALLRVNRGSQQSIDLLQRELDALKMKQK